MQLFSSVNCDTTRVNIIVLSVPLQPKTKHCSGCVKWGCRALLCDINQLFMAMKLQNIYLASWYTRPRPQKTNRHLYQRRTGVNSRVERHRVTTRGRWWRFVREVWEKPIIDWKAHIKQRTHYPVPHRPTHSFWHWHHTQRQAQNGDPALMLILQLSDCVMIK